MCGALKKRFFTFVLMHFLIFTLLRIAIRFTGKLGKKSINQDILEIFHSSSNILRLNIYLKG